MYPDERVARFITDNFIPARVHVKEDAAEFMRLGERYNAQWTPTILELDPDGEERHRVEGFLPAEDLLGQLALGLGHTAFKRGDWKTAEHHFATVAKRHADSEMAPEAVYWAGVSRYKATGDAQALGDTTKRFRDRYADSTWAKKASVWG